MALKTDLADLPRDVCLSDAGGPLPPLFLIPRAMLAGRAATAAIDRGDGLPLAGGPGAAGKMAFTTCRVFLRAADSPGEQCYDVSVAALRAWGTEEGGHVAGALDEALVLIGTRRAPFAGLSLDRPRLMGIVNVTPDSFSDGGAFVDPAAAIAHGHTLRAAGADILDVGGESTRPGADAVPAELQIRRVVPVIRALAGDGALVSIDTMDADVMAAALDAGASIVNDVSALAVDERALGLIGARRAQVVLCHMRGMPRSMQQAPEYGCAPVEVFSDLLGRVQACRAAGIPAADILVDPGIGFGKKLEHNLEILDSIALLHGTGCGVLLGASRKSFIGNLSGDAPADSRLGGSLAAALDAAGKGVQFFRVHDVAETRQALDIFRAIGTFGGND